ncbi:PREDICTED: uncharacterized protein LOC104811315 [Tarenaya hassleriana]|uniref:uncharacterized protein LOC104811315 n=1 Tax=Tarenaya hassleriana TaxID=28532 RepID=UPI00053C5ED1|nr:PREDICTED: uncharacterized protein LOC104811315 [Tarenaya hassleriana]
MATGFGKNFTACLILIAAAFTVAAAEKFTIRNEIRGAKGRDGILAVRCWSRDDKLGLHQIFPGQSRSWEFKLAVRFWPFAYTEFRCQFRTAFGTTQDENVVVFEDNEDFRLGCDKPKGQECVWVAKRSGLYLRKKIVWFKERHYEDVLKSKWVWGW